MVTKMCEFRFMRSPESHNIISPKVGLNQRAQKRPNWGGDQKEHLTHPSPKERILPQGLQYRAGHVQMLQGRFVADQF